MASIANGYSKRGHKELYDGNYGKAVECFFKAHTVDAKKPEYLMDLIYALNQNADYVRALEYCYALIGMECVPNKDMLYFFTAEAFGGIGCIGGCAQMLERCINENPQGSASEDARAFLVDLKEKYEIEQYNASGNEVSMGISNGMSEAHFLNIETYECIGEILRLKEKGELSAAIARAEAEIENDNLTVALLNMCIMLGLQAEDKEYVRRCAQRFKSIDDYTLTEIRTLAVNLSELGDNELAYGIYKQLYANESGEKDIAFGFAVACLKRGDIAYAEEILRDVSASNGGIGPAYRLLHERNDHSYLYGYEGECEKEIREAIVNKTFDRDAKMIYEAFDYAKLAEPEICSVLIENTEAFCNTLGEINLRRLAINPEVNLFARARAAEKLSEECKENIYMNIGSDIIKYSTQIDKVIMDFFERNGN